jgi:Protein of unknown function (DUF3025)
MFNPPQPWLNPLNQTACAAVLQAVKDGQNVIPLLNAALSGQRNAQGLPLHCVPQAALPAGMAYEAFIFETGSIPTRTEAGSNGALHDACNALMWLHYPHSKSTLNALQAAAIKTDGIHSSRGRLRDALTLFDESALILCCPLDDAAPQQLAQRHWTQLLHARRNDWHHTLTPLVFGHAVLQKLQTPYLAITAQVWFLANNDVGCSLEAVDRALAASLQTASDAGRLIPPAFLPLPVLGIPHWWAANEDARFYDNAAVFRPSPQKPSPLGLSISGRCRVVS